MLWILTWTIHSRYSRHPKHYQTFKMFYVGLMAMPQNPTKLYSDVFQYTVVYADSQYDIDFYDLCLIRLHIFNMFVVGHTFQLVMHNGIIWTHVGFMWVIESLASP